MAIPESAIQGAVVILAIRFLVVEARLERASRRGDLLVFHPILIARSFIPVAVVSLCGGFQTAKTGDWLATGLGFGIARFASCARSSSSRPPRPSPSMVPVARPLLALVYNLF